MSRQYYTKEQRILLMIQFEQTDVTQQEHVEEFNMYFPERPNSMTTVTWRSLKKEREQFPGTDEEWLDYHKAIITTSKNYTKEEQAWIIKNADLRINLKKFAAAFKKRFKYIRSPEALRRQVPALMGSNSLSLGGMANKKINNDNLHSTLRLKEGQDLYRGANQKYTVICEHGHETEKWGFDLGRTGCRICATSFVGGIPKNDFRPAVVYLIYVKVWKALKPGFAEGFGIEAIKKRFKRWPLPEEYEIVAYDQSTRTESAIHEQWLLNNTLEYKYFEDKQDFAGWTEFRHKEVLNELLPQYETVLDIAFKI